MGGDADTLDTEITVDVTALVGRHFHVRYSAVHRYAANTIRTGISRVEGYLHGSSPLIYQYEVRVGSDKSRSSATEHYLVGFQYKFLCFQRCYGIVIRDGIGYLLFRFLAGTLRISLGFTVCTALCVALLRIHGGCHHACQY